MYQLKENYETHKARFKEINACADESLRKMRLEGLQNDMVVCYEIPQKGHLRIAAFRNSFPEVYELYRNIENARWS